MEKMELSEHLLHLMDGVVGSSDLRIIKKRGLN